MDLIHLREEECKKSLAILAEEAQNTERESEHRILELKRRRTNTLGDFGRLIREYDHLRTVVDTQKDELRSLIKERDDLSARGEEASIIHARKLFGAEQC